MNSEDIKKVAQEAVEQTLQKRSATDSDVMREVLLLKEHLKENDKAWERNDIVNAKILEQTTATNGSVRKLQLWQAKGEGWIKGFGVALACIITLVGIIYYSLVDQQTKTQNLLESHLQTLK